MPISIDAPFRLSKKVAEELTRQSRAYCDAHPLPRQPLASVVLPSKNVAPTIVPVLEAWLAQSYKNFEVIVNLDPRSEDGSEALIRPFTERDPRIKLMFDNRGMAHGRNQGRAAAKGDYILNYDADLAPSPTMLEEAVTRGELEGEDVIICPELSVPYSFWGQCRCLEKVSYLEDTLQESCTRFIRRTVFAKLGEVDESLLAGEDYDFFQRAKAAGFKPGRIRAASWHHENWTLAAKARKMYRYGRSFNEYLERYPVLGTQQFFFIRRAYLVHWKLYLSYPLHTAGTILANLVFYGTCGWGLATSLVQTRWKKLKQALGGAA